LLGGSKADSEETIEQIPVISEQTLDILQEQAERMGNHLSWGVIAFSLIMQIGAWIAAAGKLRTIKRGVMESDERFMQLEAIEVYFDLPLYYGLLGTVLAFIVITIFPDAGLMFAYVSTALGIIVSVILRIFFLTPYKQQLISSRKNVRL